jgi:hypothetical protein
LHLVYFQGDPKQGDVCYVRSTTQPPDFSTPLRVNAQPGSAAIAGHAQGPQLAVDGQGKAHVVWIGAGGAGEAAVFYARPNQDGNGFEAPRQLAKGAAGSLGGAAVAVGNSAVFVFWHAPGPRAPGEGGRRVWLAQSLDGGKTFAAARPISPAASAVCADSAMCALLTHPHMPVLLYRAAIDGAHRNLQLLYEDARAFGFREVTVQAWKAETCPPATAALVNAPSDYLAAWETGGQIYFTRIPHHTANVARILTAPGAGGNRTRPAIANNGRETALVWVETPAKGQPPSLRWQLFSPADLATPAQGELVGVPAGSHAAVVPYPTGQFLIIY